MKHNKTYYRAIWISDLHLGFRGCKAKELLGFLKSVECDLLYLVGDIFDFLAIRRHFYWSMEVTNVVRHILKMMDKGTKVIYLPGNHDEQIRLFVPALFGTEFEIVNEAIHITSSGMRVMVIHGDQFDFVVGHLKWLTILGTTLYDLLLELNGVLHHCRVRLGFKNYWSLSAYLKTKAKKAVCFIQDFEKAALLHAAHQDCKAVVCGHIHTPALRRSHDGIVYANCGDFVESISAIVETMDGQLELLRPLPLFLQHGI